MAGTLAIVKTVVTVLHGCLPLSIGAFVAIWTVDLVANKVTTSIGGGFLDA